jgi:glycosyltransferase involved in cell wall biosynthesis
VLGGADAVLVVSSALAEHARELGVPSERITVLPNAVDASRFHPAVSAERVRSLYGLERKRVIGFVGSLKRWHDLDTLLAAVERLARADSRIHLLVVGHGPRFGEVQSFGADFVTCTGAVAHDQVPELLAAMDVVVCPYPRGGDRYFSPLKLVEAMAMARPLVGARHGQVAEIISDRETGLLYEPGDALDLAERLAEVLELPDRGAALGAAARRDVVPARTWELNARRIISLANSLTKARKERP